MKKLFILSGLGLVVLGFAFFLTVNCSSSKVAASSMLKNLEALARTESDGNYKWTSNIKCEGYPGSYQSCNENGSGNSCSPGGSVTCDCKTNCSD